MAKNYCVYSLLKIIGISYKSKDTIQLSLIQSSASIAYSDEVKRVLPQIHDDLFHLFLSLKPECFFDDFIKYMPIMFCNNNIEEVLERLPSDIQFSRFDKAYLEGIAPPNDLQALKIYYQDMQMLIQIHDLTDLDQIEQLLMKTSLRQETKRKQLMEIMKQKPNIEEALKNLSKANINLYNIKQEKKNNLQREIKEIKNELKEEIEEQTTELKNQITELKEKMRKDYKEEINTILSEKNFSRKITIN